MWTAITLWLVHVVGIAIYAAYAWRTVAGGAAWLPWAIALLIAYAALVLVITLFEFLLAWVLRAPRTPEQRIRPAQTLRMIWREFVTLLGSAWRMMSFGWRLRDPLAAPSRLPIVLVHGVLCNAGVWIPMARKLAAAGIGPVYALSYGPPLAWIDEFVRQLDGRINTALEATSGSRVMLVTHSMGGLVVRAYLRAYGGAKVARVVTIGAPHHGSGFACFVPGACMSQMRPGNDWLAALPAAAVEPPMVSLWSPHDSMVVPQTSSLLAGATNVAFPGIGHNALLRDDAIFARVVDEIRTAQERLAR